ncbi:MAG: hypothetical protein C4K58_06705 [Flavobacteriaceae bacterium]|nr:MAG: hypothetical protein C4K58_06705 [Flavobacteriaceae bacterium]
MKNKLFSATIFLSFASIILIVIQTFRRAFRPIGNDFTCYLISASDFIQGKNPYTTDSAFPYIYPQFFDVLMLPFTFVPYWLAVFLWISISYFSLFYTIKIILRILNPENYSFYNTLVYFSAINLLQFAILQNNFLNGQVNIILLFLCTLFLYYHLRKNIFFESLFLAIAISIKITPAFLLIFLLFHKKIKTILLTSVLAFLFIFGLPFLLTGFKSIEYYKYYLDTFILHKTMQGDEIIGYSLSSIFSYVTPKFAVILSAFTMIVVNFLNQKLSVIESSKIQKTILFSLYLISILFISPMSEGHHLILIFPAYIYLLDFIIKKPNKILTTIFVIITIVPLVFRKVDLIVFPTLLLLYFIISKLNLSISESKNL